MDEYPENRIDQTRSRRPDEDRISNLPDSVLHHILGFVSTKDTVRTSSLSIRWQNLWKLVPCLDLDVEDFSDENDFLNFMDNFVLRGNSDLHKFKLKYYLSEQESSRIKTWIDAAVMCKLEYLDIYNYCPLGDGVKMPLSLYMCKTLVVLKLIHVVLDIPELVSLSSLKIIDFDSVIYANDSAFESFISGCPVLEELNLYRLTEDNLKVLCICSPTLKRLTIKVERSGDGKEYEVVIDAPRLEYLSLRDHQSESFTIKNFDLLFEADIDVIFNVDYWDELEAGQFSKRNSICRLLVAISNVRSLSISWDTLEVLSLYNRLDTLPKFNDLIHLKAMFGDLGWEILPLLLECCPNLQTFILGTALPKSSPLVLSSVAPQCMLSSLESITIEKPITWDAMQMDLVRYFLKYSAVLKQMKVHISTDPNPEEVSFIRKKILMFPKCSTACQVIVD